jgi:outer membrane protein OmpA-like peptidoglycan-associated protein
VVAVAPELGIVGDDLDVEAGETPLSMRIELGEVKVELTNIEVAIDDTLYFALGSADLADEARSSLAAVARTLRSNPSVRKVRIEGHADRSGSTERNQSLSEQRARAVLEALEALGVERHRLDAIGFGETQPISVEEKDGGARNRRVVFRVVEVADAVQLNPDSAQ